MERLGKGVWKAKSNDSDETVSRNSPRSSKSNDFVRDCHEKQGSGTIKATISYDTVKKSRRREHSRASKSNDFGRDCHKKHESVRNHRTHFGTTVSAKSYIFEHEGPTNLKKRPFSICAGRRLSKTSSLRNRARSQDVRNGISCCCDR